VLGLEGRTHRLYVADASIVTLIHGRISALPLSLLDIPSHVLPPLPPGLHVRARLSQHKISVVVRHSHLRLSAAVRHRYRRCRRSR
jgi:hypothetical protein